MRISMKKKIAKGLLLSSFPIVVIGYFLQTILIPIQDFNTLTKEEIKKIQLDVAINYPLGTFMLYVGGILFLFSSTYLVITKCRNKKGI